MRFDHNEKTLTIDGIENVVDGTLHKQIYGTAHKFVGVYDDQNDEFIINIECCRAQVNVYGYSKANCDSIKELNLDKNYLLYCEMLDFECEVTIECMKIE